MIKLPWSGKKKVGLALSGGVARSLAHIGILKVFKREKIPIKMIAATSGGAMVGSLFAFGLDPDYIEEVFTRDFNLLRVSIDQINPFTNNTVQEFIEDVLGKVYFKDADIPIAVIAQDIKSGKTVVLKSGKVAPAVAASSAFPGIFNPKKINGMSLIDGGGADNLPVAELIRMKASITIAVDVISDRPLKKDTKNPIQVLGRALDLAIKKLTADARAAADICIEPEIPMDIWHADYHKSKIIIEAGEKAALKKIQEIKALL
ncbi:patatin-like phospholipase family protein [Candidatus Margulisiibacteriota bacterium]